MIKYREHSGSLDDSLATSMEFNSLKELFDFLVKKMFCPGSDYVKIRNLKIMYYGFDERCNQELYMVSYESETDNGITGGVFGFIYEDVI